jgi:hypothetical protein
MGAALITHTLDEDQNDFLIECVRMAKTMFDGMATSTPDDNPLKGMFLAQADQVEDLLNTLNKVTS